MNIKVRSINFFFLRLKTLSLIGIIAMTSFSNAYAQLSLEELKDPILAVKEMYFRKINPDVDAVTYFNGHLEFWTFDSLDKETHSLRITSYQNQTFYMDIYIVQDEKLIYALEEVKGMPLNHRTQSIWRCEYFIKDGQVIDYTSLGHGKTEDGAWRSEDILVQFRARKVEFDKIQK